MSQNPETLSRIYSIREEHKLVLPLLYEVNMKGRKAIPHIRHQAEYNLVINPTKQRKYPFPYRRDIIYLPDTAIARRSIACLPVWFYTNMFSICAILMGNLEQSVYYVHIYMNRRLLSSPPSVTSPFYLLHYSHIRYALSWYFYNLYMRMELLTIKQPVALPGLV